MREHGVPKCLKDLIDEFEFNDLKSLENLLKKGDVAAVILEPQALTTPKSGYLEGVRKLCTKYKAILIFDEVVTGFRWSLGGAQEYFGVTPDLCCMGKAVANGMPLGIIAGKAEYMNELNHVFFSMTFGGEALSLVAAIATIKELKTKDYNYIWELGNMLDMGIKNAAKKYNLDIIFAGDAPRHNLTFNSKTYGDVDGIKALFYQEMIKQDILFPNVIYIQFSHTKKDIQKTIDAADKAFKFVNENLNDIDSVLEGERAVAIFRKNN
jgi:glutamate-1-semialdehyde aminotransferase